MREGSRPGVQMKARRAHMDRERLSVRQSATPVRVREPWTRSDAAVCVLERSPCHWRGERPVDRVRGHALTVVNAAKHRLRRMMGLSWKGETKDFRHD